MDEARRRVPELQAGLFGAARALTGARSCYRWQQPFGLVLPAPPELILPLQLLQTFGRKSIKQRGVFSGINRALSQRQRAGSWLQQSVDCPLLHSRCLGSRIAKHSVQV